MNHQAGGNAFLKNLSEILSQASAPDPDLTTESGRRIAPTASFTALLAT